MRSLTHSSAGISTHPTETYYPAQASRRLKSILELPETKEHLIPNPQTQKRNHRHTKFLDTPTSRGPDLSHVVSSRTYDLLQLAIRNSWADSTLNGYSRTVQHFLNFCEKECVPANLRFPTDEFILCAYAASDAGRTSGNTIRNRMSALKAWHHAHNASWQGGMRLHIVLNGVKNLTPASSIRPPRPPVTKSMLTTLLSGLNLRSPLDAAVAACATTSFWGQCRLGELLTTSKHDTTTSQRPTRSHLTRGHKSTTFTLRLPQTKTHKRGESVIIVAQNCTSNPLPLLQHHLSINNLSQDLPLFAYTSPSGPITLTKAIFLERCNNIWSAFGYPRTTGHSFRIGGTTELLLSGVPPDVVKKMGRWASDSFLRYWRNLEDIAPIHIGNHTHHRKHRKHHARVY